MVMMVRVNKTYDRLAITRQLILPMSLPFLLLLQLILLMQINLFGPSVVI